VYYGSLLSLEEERTGVLRSPLKGKSSTTVWFAIAGSNVDKKEASDALTNGLTSPDEWLREKISGRQKVLSEAQIEVPDAQIQAAFDWGKLNLADMQRTVREVMVRDTMEGTVYPSPLVPTFPVLTGFGAAKPGGSQLNDSLLLPTAQSQTMKSYSLALVGRQFRSG
jgi:hypothetical protein